MTGSRNFWIFGKNVTRCATFCRYLIKVYTLSRFIFVKKKGKKESNKDSPISVLPLDRYKLIHRSEWDDESHSKKIRYLKCFSPIWYVNRSGGLTKRTYRMEKRKEKKRPFINEIAHCFELKRKKKTIDQTRVARVVNTRCKELAHTNSKELPRLIWSTVGKWRAKRDEKLARNTNQYRSLNDLMPACISGNRWN